MYITERMILACSRYDKRLESYTQRRRAIFFRFLSICEFRKIIDWLGRMCAKVSLYISLKKEESYRNKNRNLRGGPWEDVMKCAYKANKKNLKLILSSCN